MKVKLKVRLTGYVFDGKHRHAPGEVLEVGEQDARHIERSGAGQVLPEEAPAKTTSGKPGDKSGEKAQDTADSVPSEDPNEVIGDGPRGSEPVLPEPPK